MQFDPAVRSAAGPTHGGTMMAAPAVLVASTRSRPHSPTGLPATSRSRRWRAAWPVTVSWTLGTVLVAATTYGLLAGHAYRINRNLELASLGQDVLTLMVVPLLIWAGHRSRAGSLRGHLLWLGMLAYVAYAYATYLIGIPHNDAFLLYATALGLSAAALLDGLLRIDVAAASPAFAGLPRRGVGRLLVLTGTAFAVLWLADVVPAIPAAAPPQNLGPGGVPFAIYVLDLSLVLPAVMATGVLLVRGHPAGPLLAAVVLAKIVALGLAMEAAAVALVVDGLVPDPATTSLFAVLVVACGALLAHGSRRLGAPAAGWLRPTLWDR
jgi:hypothetical protein